MVLQYNFEYTSNNNTLLLFLDRCTKKIEDIDYKINRDNSFIKLFVSANEDRLLAFSDEISKGLPMSIFLKNTEVLESSDFENIINEKLDLKKDNILPFCPDCLNEIEDKNSKNYKNPFLSCEICGQKIKSDEFILDTKSDRLSSRDYQKIIKTIAKEINENKKVKIKTFSGDFVFAKDDKFFKDTKILLLDINSVHKFSSLNKQEIISLVSIEKPSLDIDFSNTITNIRYPNDFILYLLSKELSKYGLEFLYYSKSDEFDIELSFKTDANFKKLDIPNISVLQSGQIIIKESNNYNKILDEVYSKFDENNKAHFMTILEENSLYSKNILNFYSSKIMDDCIALYSKDINSFVNILEFKIPNNMRELIEEIKSDTTGSRLFVNYFNDNMDIYDKIESSKIDEFKNSLYSCFCIAGLFLGLEGDSFDLGNKILQKAKDSKVKRGPKIDFKFKQEITLLNNEFDLARLIRSCMSYKLAGVESELIALGLVESFIEFMDVVVNKCNEEFNLDGLSLSGSLFAKSFVTDTVEQKLKKDYKIYYNKDFPIEKIVR